jgi:alpha-galactosidase
VSRHILIEHEKIDFLMEVDDANNVKLLNFSPKNAINIDSLNIPKSDLLRPVEIKLCGENHDDHHGLKHTNTYGASTLKYFAHEIISTGMGPKLELILKNNEGLVVKCCYQLYKDISVIRSWVELKNEGNDKIGIEYVTSFVLYAIDKGTLTHWSECSYLHVIHNSWVNELQWRRYSLRELGLSRVEGEYQKDPNGLQNFTLKRIYYKNTGTWSTCEYLPMGAYENVESGITYLWQIENQGSWYYEIGDKNGHLYLHLCGPTYDENMWLKWLKNGERFISVPVAIAVVAGSFEEALQELTQYRRIIRRKNEDNIKLPVIFNDYMNCLFGDPTTEKLIPIIDKASEIGCEYFVIDAGWYGDDFWWDSVGEWLPSKRRFPNGIREVIDYIKSKEMTPGLWLEIEVMGVNCKLAKKAPDDWFFMRNGKRVIDHGRYQLDFRNPEVRRFADSVIQRLVEEYGVGYIKMDYNINAGPGTDSNTDSLGEGLLEHNRAYLEWIDSIFIKYPHLIIENCSSGGMRMDYALLSKLSIQSTSDQTDYRLYSYIAASAPIGATPEQCAVWSFPVAGAEEEEVIFNMVNAMLLRIHQSGEIWAMEGKNLGLIKEGIAYYKKIRNIIPQSLPFWPLGIPKREDKWLALGLKDQSKILLAVWKVNASNDTCIVPLPFIKNKNVVKKSCYPAKAENDFIYHKLSGNLCVKMKAQFAARVFEIGIEE